MATTSASSLLHSTSIALHTTAASAVSQHHPLRIVLLPIYPGTHVGPTSTKQNSELRHAHSYLVCIAYAKNQSLLVIRHCVMFGTDQMAKK